MNRNFTESNNRKRRNRKTIIFMSCEGSNKTEINYFRHFNQNNNKFRLVFLHRNYTDAFNLVKILVEEKKNNKKDPSAQNDIYCCVFDTDNDLAKYSVIDNAYNLAKINNIRMIYSAPCFEKYFIDHFIYTSRPFANSSQAISYLKSYIPNYNKNLDVYNLLIDKLNIALFNGNKLNKFYESTGKHDYKSRESYSEIFKLFDIIHSI